MPRKAWINLSPLGINLVSDLFISLMNMYKIILQYSTFMASLFHPQSAYVCLCVFVCVCLCVYVCVCVCVYKTQREREKENMGDISVWYQPLDVIRICNMITKFNNKHFFDYLTYQQNCVSLTDSSSNRSDCNVSYLLQKCVLYCTYQKTDISRVNSLPMVTVFVHNYARLSY